MQDRDTYERLRDFVAKELLNGDARELDAETPLLAWGILDSMSLIRLTDFIEEELKVQIPTDALADSANLQNLGTIARMVTKYAAPDA
jgi:clorobiocin biosynthesis protein CloN5